MLSDYGQGTEAIVDRHARVRKRGKQELLAFTAMTCGEGRAVTEVDQAFSDTPGADAERLCIYGVRRHLRACVQTQVIDQIRMVVVRENPPDLSPVAKPQSTGRYGVLLLMPFRVITWCRGMAVSPLAIPAACP